MMNRSKHAALVVLLCVAFVPIRASAQTPPAAQKSPSRSRKHNVPGTPLDTLMKTHLTTTVPAAEDFVRDARPDPGTLDYTPLTGSDPDRPKLRDKANIEALQADLEQSGAKNAAHGKAMRPASPRHHAKATN